MTETTLYLAWIAYWDSNDSTLLGVYRTRAGAQAVLDATDVNPAIMSRWIAEEPLQD